MERMRERWSLFCRDADLGHPREALGQVTAAGLKAFLDWMIENAERAALQAGTLLQYFRIMKMVYKQDTGSILDEEVAEDVADFIRFHASQTCAYWSGSCPYTPFPLYKRYIDLPWAEDDFIEAIRIAFHTVLDDNAPRDSITRLAVQNGSRLTNDPDFVAVVGTIPDLGVTLSKQECRWTDAQRACPQCHAIFLSNCAFDGCSTDEDHHCDLRGSCKSLI